MLRRDRRMGIAGRRPRVRPAVVFALPVVFTLREALARHNARLSSNSSDICCSRSIKTAILRESDLGQSDMKYPTAMRGTKAQKFEGFLTFVSAFFLDYRR